MKTWCKSLCLLSLLGISNVACEGENRDVDTSTVREFDIERFMGKWYEIARYDHHFEKGMDHVVANYSLMEDGKVKVVNHGIKNGKSKEITGKARQPNPEEYPGRLEVSFFLWFYSPYWVLELDENYQYALIGSDTSKYLWIMSRTPELPKATLDKLLQEAQRRGYDLSRLTFVNQGK